MLGIQARFCWCPISLACHTGHCTPRAATGATQRCYHIRPKRPLVLHCAPLVATGATQWCYTVHPERPPVLDNGATLCTPSGHWCYTVHSRWFPVLHNGATLYTPNGHWCYTMILHCTLGVVTLLLYNGATFCTPSGPKWSLAPKECYTVNPERPLVLHNGAILYIHSERKLVLDNGASLYIPGGRWYRTMVLGCTTVHP